MDTKDSYIFKLVFGILGNIIGFGVNMAPMPTFWRIYKDKNTHGYSGLPYVFSLVAALLWVLYGLPSVTPNEWLLISINCMSGSIQFFYISVFLRYAALKPRWHVMRVMAACFTALGIATAVTLFAIPRPHRTIVVGSLCVVIGVMTYASPLSVARMVIETKSVEFLPILLCVFFLINSSVWTCYGVVTKDVFVLTPNVLGVIFGVAQFALYAYYHNAEPFDESFQKGKIADATVRASPLNGFIKNPIASPAHGFVRTPMASPLNGFIRTPMASPLNGFVRTPTASPFNGFVKTPFYTPDGNSVKSEKDFKARSVRQSTGDSNTNVQPQFFSGDSNGNVQPQSFSGDSNGNVQPQSFPSDEPSVGAGIV